MAISKILISNLNDIYVNFFSSVSNDLFNPKSESISDYFSNFRLLFLLVLVQTHI